MLGLKPDSKIKRRPNDRFEINKQEKKIGDFLCLKININEIIKKEKKIILVEIIGLKRIKIDESKKTYMKWKRKKWLFSLKKESLKNRKLARKHIIEKFKLFLQM